MAGKRRKHKANPSEHAILGMVRKLVDPETGELVKAFTPAYGLDKRAINAYGLREGDLVVMDIFQDRNTKFWRLWHKLGEFVGDNRVEFNGIRPHDVIKKLQLAADIHCEVADFVLEDGTVLRHRVAKSLNFRDTDEAMAQQIWNAICEYVALHYFFEWTPEQVAEAADHWERYQ